jgi:hypothetical protein
MKVNAMHARLSSILRKSQSWVALVVLPLCMGLASAQTSVPQLVQPIYTPEQTAKTWVSALKRNDLNALMLLALTPERYLQEREQVRMVCYVKGEANWGAWFALDQSDPREKLFESLATQLATANSRRDRYAQDLQNILDELLNNSEDTLNPEQAAAVQEVGMAMKGWALRTDFSNERRLRKAIDVIVTELTAVHQVFAECDQHSTANLLKTLDRVLVAFKGVAKAYDLDLNQLLAQTKVSDAGIKLVEGKGLATVRIDYRVFEARGSSVLALYQLGEQWFFWREALF